VLNVLKTTEGVEAGAAARVRPTASLTCEVADAGRKDLRDLIASG